MKLKTALLLAMLSPAAFAAGFDEKFAGDDLAVQSWMQTIVDRCKGVAYQKPLNGKLVLSGLMEPQPGASAVLERDACYTTGDFHWIVDLELDFSKNTQGTYSWNIMSDNGEVQLGVALQKNKSGSWEIKGLRGHTCKSLSEKIIRLEKNPCKLEIIRRKTGYQLLCNGQLFFSADGDTAALASIRLTVSGNAGKAVKSMQLKKL